MTFAYLMNERIYTRDVRLIDENGTQRGVVSYRDAMTMARSANLDLVQINNATPPVCKIVDGGKFIYEQKKHQKELEKKQRAAIVTTKEVQLRPSIDIHDLKIKARKAREFLADGDKVKVVMRFRGRENTHKEIGHAAITTFLSEVGEAKIEKQPSEQGNELSVILAPIKVAPQK